MGAVMYGAKEAMYECWAVIVAGVMYEKGDKRDIGCASESRPVENGGDCMAESGIIAREP